MEELLLYEAKHCCGILRWPLEDLFYLQLDDLIGYNSQFETESHRAENTEIVADEADDGSPEQDIRPAP